MNPIQMVLVSLIALPAAAVLAFKLRRRLQLSRAKHRSLAGHSRIGLRIARLVPYYEFDETRLFASDGAPAEVAQRRREGFQRLADLHAARFAETARLTA